MKKVLSLLFAALLLIGFLPAVTFHGASADGFDKSQIYEPYFILVNADDADTSYRGIEQDADKQIYPASTTKILTCIIALEKGNLQDMVTVSAKAVDFGRGNSLMGLEEGDRYTLEDLLYGMMLPSGNDAAIAIAEHIAGSTEAFADLMNEKAEAIGMKHSHFVTVHGKQNEKHYSTARDMAILTAYALNKSPQSKKFREIVGTKTYTAKSGPRALNLVNSNRMLYDMPATETLPEPISCLYPDAIGVKTGDTNAAGKCLIAAAERDGVTLIAVLYGGTLNDPDYNSGWSDGRKDKYNARRFQDAAAMFDYAFNDMRRTITFADLINSGLQTEFDIEIPNAAADDSQGGILKAKASVSPDKTFTVMMTDPKLTAGDLEIRIEKNITSMYAPISEGSVVGTVSYIYHDVTLDTVSLIASRSVREGTIVPDVTTVTAPPANVVVSDSETPSNVQATSKLIGGVNEPSVDSTGDQSKKKAGKCSSDVPAAVYVVIIVLIVILLAVIIMFCLYLRAEKKRREAAKRRARRRRAQQLAQQQSQQYDQYDRPIR